jgi:hypothetical protein
MLLSVILGIAQGASVLLPVSSPASGIVPWWSGCDQPAHVYDMALCLGMLLAGLVYIWRDWLARSGRRAQSLLLIQHPDTRLLFCVAVGALPAVATGVLFNDRPESFVSAWFLAALMSRGTMIGLMANQRVCFAGRWLSVIPPRWLIWIGLAAAWLPQLPGSVDAALTRQARSRLVQPLIQVEMVAAGWWTAVNQTAVRLKRTNERRGAWSARGAGVNLCLVYARPGVGSAEKCARVGTRSLPVALFP